MTHCKLIVLRVVSAVAIVVWAAFIFGFSGQTGGESGGLSARVADVLVSVGDWLTGAVTAGEARAVAIEALQFPIRKAAHMSEYAVLALLVFAQLRLWPSFSGLGLPVGAKAEKRSGEQPALPEEPMEAPAVSRARKSEFLLQEAGDCCSQAAQDEEKSRTAQTIQAGEEGRCAQVPRGLPQSSRDLYLKTLRKAALMAWGCATLYAATDEFHQLFVPGRAGLFTDVLIDATGAAIGLLLAGSIVALAKRPR